MQRDTRALASGGAIAAVAQVLAHALGAELAVTLLGLSVALGVVTALAEQDWRPLELPLRIVTVSLAVFATAVGSTFSAAGLEDAIRSPVPAQVAQGGPAPEPTPVIRRPWVRG